MKYASFWQRLVAQVFEGQLQWFGLVGLFALGAGSVLSLPDLMGLVLVLLVVVFWSPLVTILYYSYFTSVFGGPLGKLLLGIAVVDEKDRELSFFKAFFRSTVGYSVSNLILGFGYLWVFRNAEHQGWHDLISDSFVVNRTGNAVRTVGLGVATVVLLMVNSYFAVSSVQTLGSNGLLIREIQNFVEDLDKTIPAPETSSPETLEI